MEQNNKVVVMNKSEGGEEVEMKYVYNEKLSRLFIFRGLWIYIVIWPLLVWMIWISIISLLHFFYKLIFGKRKKSWWEKEVRFLNYNIKWQMYWSSIIDKRPKVIEE